MIVDADVYEDLTAVKTLQRIGRVGNQTYVLCMVTYSN